MVNIWLLEFRVPPLHVKNKIINTGKKKKQKREEFNIKIFIYASWDIYRNVFMLFWQCELFFSLQSRKSMGDLQNEIWKEVEEKISLCISNYKTIKLKKFRKLYLCPPGPGIIYNLWMMHWRQYRPCKIIVDVFHFCEPKYGLWLFYNERFIFRGKRR